MSRYIKYYENGGKNMSFVIKDDGVPDKYNEKPCITLAWPETGKKELPTSLFRKMQIQIKENKDNQIYKH